MKILTNIQQVPIVLEKAKPDDEKGIISKNIFTNCMYTTNDPRESFLHRLIFKKIEVKQTAFYDLGFDPSFSEDGNFFYQERSLAFFVRSIIRVLCRIKYFIFPPQIASVPKEFHQLVQIEKNWQKAAQAEGMLYKADNNDFNKAFWQLKSPFICELKEHQFLKQLSHIASLRNKTYASELLKPLHAFNRPQKPSSQSKMHILAENGENSDIGRLSSWGFSLLGDHTKEYKNFYIKHRDFLHAIDTPGDKLKRSVRELRTVIRQQDYHAFNEKLKVFEAHWDEYVGSHELLKTLSSMYSQESFFENKYQEQEELYQEMQNPHVYAENNFLMNLSQKISSAFNYQEGSERIYKGILSKLPDSSTAKLEMLKKRELAFLQANSR